MEIGGGDITQNDEIGAKVDDDRPIIGDVILGDVDPRTLSREAFDASPDLLFHGSPRPFSFNPDFDYSDPAYQEQDYGTSMTLGIGFYAAGTEDARDYAEVRAGYAALSGIAEPYVAKLLPYQARCLDLRSAADPAQNAPLPVDFANKWIAFFEASRTDPERFDSVDPKFRRLFEEFETRYSRWLAEASDEEKTANIQGLLVGGSRSPSPIWMRVFTEFMLSEGYDGMIVNQGSEKHNDRGVTSYVFYNLHKIGTYESWHADKVEATQ